MPIAVRRPVRPLAFATTFAALLIAARAPAEPDLTPEIYGVSLEANQTIGSGDVAEGCAGATDDRTLLRFGMRVHNVGDAPEVIGDPGCPDCKLFPGASCANPDFVCSPANGHMHPHFEGFSRYELFDMHGNSVAIGAKRGFCIRDDGPEPGCATYDCNNQGISVGCFDDYGPTLGCQYIDVTDVPGIMTRAFRLRVTVDPLQLLVDGDRANDVTEVVLPGCGDGVLDAGETCDPGIPIAGACCDADCHLIPGCDASCALGDAGTICRPASGPCDVPELCDGVSPSCPPDVAVADGTSCGDASPCLSDVCRAGACVVERLETGCLVGGGCYPAGAVDPGDACQRCDPSRTVDVWSPDRDPDPAGVRCQVTRVQTAARAMACPAAIDRRVARRLDRAQTIAGRLAAVRVGREARVAASLLRTTRDLERLLERGEKRGCKSTAALAEIAALRDQLRAMKAAGG